MFFQNILKSKPCDQSIQARKKLFYHMIVKNYLCSNVSWKFLINIESTWRHEIKEQAPQLTLLYCGRTVISSYQRCCTRRPFLKMLQYPQETPVLESIKKSCRPLDLQLYYKETPTQVFSCEYCKFFYYYLFWKTFANSRFLMFPMVHSYMDLKV